MALALGLLGLPALERQTWVVFCPANHLEVQAIRTLGRQLRERYATPMRLGFEEGVLPWLEIDLRADVLHL